MTVKMEQWQRDIFGGGIELRNVYTIDPGLGGTGWAYWKRLQYGRPSLPNAVGCVVAREGTWKRRANVIQCAVENVVCCADATLVIEFPELWSGSAISQTAASQGDLFKLAYLCGRLSTCAPNVFLPTPRQWKGQLPKRAVDRELERMGATKKMLHEHTSDAVGIGVFLATEQR